MKVAVGRSYRIYGKVGGMKRFKPLGGNSFVENLIHAEIFTPQCDDDCEKLNREISFLNKSNNGEFELRPI